MKSLASRLAATAAAALSLGGMSTAVGSQAAPLGWHWDDPSLDIGSGHGRSQPVIRQGETVTALPAMGEAAKWPSTGQTRALKESLAVVGTHV